MPVDSYGTEGMDLNSFWAIFKWVVGLLLAGLSYFLTRDLNRIHKTLDKHDERLDSLDIARSGQSSVIDSKNDHIDRLQVEIQKLEKDFRQEQLELMKSITVLQSQVASLAETVAEHQSGIKDFYVNILPQRFTELENKIIERIKEMK